jgi:hypothetical protein
LALSIRFVNGAFAPGKTLDVPNKNYLAGRRLEYKIKKEWEKQGFIVLRTAGSHGPFDLVAYRMHHPVVMIQCKRVATLGQAMTLIRKWTEKPPIAPGVVHFQQRIEVYVKSERKLFGFTV